MEQWCVITSKASGSVLRYSAGTTDPTFNSGAEDLHVLDHLNVVAGVPLYRHTVSNGQMSAMIDEQALPLLKVERLTAIDMRTRDLIINGGFVYDGRTFSSSETAQKNLSEMRENKATLTYPFLMATKNNSEIYSIADANVLEAMYGVGFDTVAGHYSSGNVLKSQVLAATTKAELDAIVDNR